MESVSVDAQQSLTDKGIRFPAGASAIFLPGSSKLVVRDTPEQLDLIANLIEQLSKETPQVQIEAKLAEFNQDAIKALSFNYIVGIGHSANRPSHTGLRTSDYPTTDFALGGLTPNGISATDQSKCSLVRGGDAGESSSTFTG